MGQRLRARVWGRPRGRSGYDGCAVPLPPAPREDARVGATPLYEYNLRGELGEDAAGVAKLREKLVWVDPGRKSLGFSEHHPVDNLGRDGYRSQANRRVEVLFFDEGEEPDMDLAATAPEQSELYLPGKYRREHLGAMLSAKPKAPFAMASQPVVPWDGPIKQYSRLRGMMGNKPRHIQWVKVAFRLIIGYLSLAMPRQRICTPDTLPKTR